MVSFTVGNRRIDLKASATVKSTNYLKENLNIGYITRRNSLMYTESNARK